VETVEDGLTMTDSVKKKNCRGLHRYRRRNLTRKKDKEPYLVFACIDCTHHIEMKLSAGKVARCYFCNNEFIITPKHFEYAKIKCDNCVKKTLKREEVSNALDELLDNLFKD
jgi:hypothetical protein